METAVIKPPFVARINFRLIAFVLVIGALVGYPVYIYLEQTLTGGIKNAGGGFKEVNLKAMSNFPFDNSNGKLEDVPDKWRNLDGQKVILEGEMWSPYMAGNRVHNFQLVYSIAKCCFNGPPQIQHFVQARAVPGASIGYYNGPVRVKGTLHVDVRRDEEAGKVTSVYQLDVEELEPVS
jgi:hypothetical protein